MYFVLALLIVLGILFAIDKIRPDYLALAALSLLIFNGTLTAGEALTGFGNTSGSPIVCYSDRGLIKPVLLSSFISNTATAVILATIVIKIAEEASLLPHTLVITLAIAAFHCIHCT